MSFFVSEIGKTVNEHRIWLQTTKLIAVKTEITMKETKAATQPPTTLDAQICLISSRNNAAFSSFWAEYFLFDRLQTAIMDWIIALKMKTSPEAATEITLQAFWPKNSNTANPNFFSPIEILGTLELNWKYIVRPPTATPIEAKNSTVPLCEIHFLSLAIIVSFLTGAMLA